MQVVNTKSTIDNHTRCGSDSLRRRCAARCGSGFNGGFQGICIETHKFFDHVTRSQAAGALAYHGLPPFNIYVWIDILQNMRRYPTLKRHVNVHTESISASRGLPQGDPLVMITAALVLAKWLESMDPSLQVLCLLTTGSSTK